MKPARRQPFMHTSAIVVLLALSLSACNSHKAAPAPLPPETVVESSSALPQTTTVEPAATSEVTTRPAEPGAPLKTSSSILSEDWQPLAAECEWGTVVVAENATITRAAPTQKLGPLFSTGGSFAAKPADESCDPGQELGPFLVSDGGSLVARLTGSPPAPNQWSLHNWGTSLRIVYEPLLGENDYGAGQEILSFAIPAEKNEAEMGGSWSGPGRLRAYIGAPWGSGPLTYSCFEQTYTAEAEIVEVAASGPVLTGMALRQGDTIVTADGRGEVLISGSKEVLGSGTEVTFQHYGSSAQIASATPSTISEEDLRKAFVAEIIRVLRDMDDEKIKVNAADIADIEKLIANGNLRFGEVSGGGNAEWTRASGSSSILYDSYLQIDQSTCGEATLTGDKNLDARLIIETAASIVHELTHSRQNGAAWDKSVEDNMLGMGHPLEAEAYYATLDRIESWWRATEAKWDKNADKCVQLKTARLVQSLTHAWGVYLADVESKDLSQRSELAKRWKQAEADIPTLEHRLKLSEQLLHEPGQDWSLRWQRMNEVEDAQKALNQAIGDRDSGRTAFGWDGKPGEAVWFRLRDRSKQQQELRARYNEVTTWIEAAEKDCDEKPDLYIARPTRRCVAAYKAILLQKGKVWGKSTGTTASPTVNVPLNGGVTSIKPSGTQYSVEKQGDTAIVRVYDGYVTITSGDRQPLSVAAGQQVQLPDGEISALVPEREARVGGVTLADLRLDSDVPEPFGLSQMRAESGVLPSDWSWQEPNRDLNGPGDATLAVLDANTLRITVPDQNEFYAYRSDAPRLLHKATGDFDLEAEMLLECRGTHFATIDFLLFTPDTPLGRLQGQMTTGGLGDHYFSAGGDWSHWQDGNRLSVVNRRWAECVEAPDEPIRVKYSRRGDQFKAYWSMDDGETWTLSARRTISLPETVWAGWLFKRMASEGLVDEPAIITLSDIRLTTAELGAMPQEDWDLAGQPVQVSTLADSLLMVQDGTNGIYAQAYSSRPITGNLDLIVSYEAAPLQSAPNQERSIQIALASNDEKNRACVSNLVKPDVQRYVADMSINPNWYRYYFEDTQESSGRVRLVREDDVFTGYFWKDGDWVPFADWQEGFSDPVYLDFRFQWQSSTPEPQGVLFTIERLVTADGLLIGSDESLAPSPSTAAGAKGAEPALTPFVEPASTPAPSAQPATTLALTGEQQLEANALFDDFSSTALNWSVRDNEAATTEYADGGYAIRVKQSTYWVMSKVPGAFPHRLLEFDAAVAQGSTGGMYGVICHFENDDNYDFVAIDPETASVSAGRLVAGAFEFLSGNPDGTTEQPAQGLARSITDANTISVGCLEDRLELTVGSKLEGSWPLDPPGTSGAAALFVYGFNGLGQDGYKVVFDNLSARAQAETSPAVANPVPVQPTASAVIRTCPIAVTAQIAPQWDRNVLGCPVAPATTTWAAVQAFERGLMVWREDLRYIYTFPDGGRWVRWLDLWSDGLALAGRGQPPAGLQAPVHGFGFVWETEAAVFQDLGWARWEESGMCAVVQEFEKGLVFVRSETDSCDGRVSSGASGWFGSVETYADGTWR